MDSTKQAEYEAVNKILNILEGFSKNQKDRILAMALCPSLDIIDHTIENKAK
jgi:hypothetical protein